MTSSWPVCYGDTTWASCASNYQKLCCLFTSLFGWRTKKHQIYALVALCEGNPSVTAQGDSNVDSTSMSSCIIQTNDISLVLCINIRYYIEILTDTRTCLKFTIYIVTTVLVCSESCGVNWAWRWLPHNCRVCQLFLSCNNLITRWLSLVFKVIISSLQPKAMKGRFSNLFVKM